jgi:hypothetical protein
MGLIKHGRRKAESDTRAKCRLFERREDKVEQSRRSNERHSLSLLSQTERAEALVITGTAALTLSMHVQAAIP